MYSVKLHRFFQTPFPLLNRSSPGNVIRNVPLCAQVRDLREGPRTTLCTLPSKPRRQDVCDGVTSVPRPTLPSTMSHLLEYIKTAAKKTAVRFYTILELLKAEVGSQDSLSISRAYFTVERIRQIFLSIRVPICKHIRPSDCFVADHFQADCLMLRKLDGRYRSCRCGRR
jgi:hypothetical protein